MLKKLAYGTLIVLTASSCVSSQLYDDLQSRYDALKAENESLMAQLDGSWGNGQGYSVDFLRSEVERLKNENTRLKMDLAASERELFRLKESYDALESNSSATINENFERNRKLLEELTEKEKALDAEALRLAKLQRQLADRSARVDELEGIIAAKDARMNALKDAISNALVNFEGNGLTVEQRDGKVYVSMENKLLFDSGSWDVNATGRQAVRQLGDVLAVNKEIDVLIEGHTDNVPYGGSGNIRDNWDLSTKRATAIVNILVENGQIVKSNITAAGRGEYAPVASNTTSEGRSRNRRIEVILSPKLDEINRLLSEL